MLQLTFPSIAENPAVHVLRIAFFGPGILQRSPPVRNKYG